ncbi:MAG: prepilin-type N-terminal cleavage/methylation domain-containing protein [Candidatus Krumholzibacteria bacterium]|nr:prepilin-type N-terminal cleavage/methylation domain-containing protein [Candidatus Krumholzibacteria bacterium]MCK5618251.1 prepilin-type N-terminal cleavage/methylation domain-containing protein [Candidatus Krumholzibacteria bacterium]
MTRQTYNAGNTSGRNAGFSLIELMVVLVILAIGLLPLALIQTRAQQDVFESGQYTEALQVAQLQMESAKSQGFGSAVTDSGAVDTYTWRATVTNVSFGLDQIVVDVQWNEKGRQRNVQIIDRVSFR